MMMQGEPELAAFKDTLNHISSENTWQLLGQLLQRKRSTEEEKTNKEANKTLSR